MWSEDVSSEDKKATPGGRLTVNLICVVAQIASRKYHCQHIISARYMSKYDNYLVFKHFNGAEFHNSLFVSRGNVRMLERTFTDEKNEIVSVQ